MTTNEGGDSMNSSDAIEAWADDCVHQAEENYLIEQEENQAFAQWVLSKLPEYQEPLDWSE